MSLTEVVSTRSLMSTIRDSISSAGIPVYCQTIETTGTSASGKMSVDIRLVLTAPSTAISTARTMNVYVRRSARRTIHIVLPSFPQHRDVSLPVRWSFTLVSRLAEKRRVNAGKARTVPSLVRSSLECEPQGEMACGTGETDGSGANQEATAERNPTRVSRTKGNTGDHSG